MKKRILLAIGVVLLIGLAIFGLTHRFVVDVTVTQGQNDEFLRENYPELFEQVTAWRNSPLEPGMQILVHPFELGNGYVYTVTEKSVLRGTRVYHLLPCVGTTLPEDFSTDPDDVWTSEFRVLSDVPDPGIWIKRGGVSMTRCQGDDLSNSGTVRSSAMELKSSDYMRTDDAKFFIGGLRFEAPLGKRPQTPLAVSFTPYQLVPPATDDDFHEGIITGSVQWYAEVHIGCVTKEINKFTFIEFPTQ